MKATDQAEALDVEVDVIRVLDVTEEEFLSMYAQVSFERALELPSQRLPDRFPTLAEARECLARSPYNPANR